MLTACTQSRSCPWSLTYTPCTPSSHHLTHGADLHTSTRMYGEASIPPSRRQRRPSQTSAHTLWHTPHTTPHQSPNPQDTGHNNQQPRTSPSTIIRSLAQSPHVLSTTQDVWYSHHAPSQRLSLLNTSPGHTSLHYYCDNYFVVLCIAGTSRLNTSCECAINSTRI